MSDGFKVDTEVLRADADYWEGWGSALLKASEGISDSFEYWAFSDQPGFEALRDEYFAAASALRQNVRDGGPVMLAMGARLTEIASIYEQTEDQNRLEIEGA